MALINCPECGERISDQCAICIHCGYPKITMDFSLEMIDEIMPKTMNRQVVHYSLLYDLVMQEEERLKILDVLEDYRLCKALAACYELQDYLAGRLAACDRDEYY